MLLRAFIVLLTSFLIVGCSDNAEIKSNKKMANDFLNLALSDNPKVAQLLTHPNFTFTFMGETEISNIPTIGIHILTIGYLMLLALFSPAASH